MVQSDIGRGRLLGGRVLLLIVFVVAVVVVVVVGGYGWVRDWAVASFWSGAAFRCVSLDGLLRKQEEAGV